MIEVVRNAADSISRKLEVEREIRVILNAKKYEQMIMNVVPLFIVVYVNITSPGIMKVMYETAMGRIIMTICLGLYIFAFLLGMKFTDIEF
ncbi:MAG: type II secretion system protein F, partial [Lachnospiraceae bacterium]|nr:type II secretion system protein F [Lachnospiraceae bacterium]